MRWTPVAAACIAAALVVNGCSDPTKAPLRDPEQPSTPQLALVGAASAGSWSAPFTWPIVASHATVLPNGKVMTWVSSDAPGDTENHDVHLWDPVTGSFTNVTNGSHNVFCSGHTFLLDGRLLVAGGHIADNKGVKDSHIFNSTSNAWENAASMRAGRWYPTATLLANGHVSIVAGSDEVGSGNPYPEVYNPSTNSWKLLRGAPLNMPYYPWMHPAPDGRIFNSGPDQVTRFLNPSGGGEWKLGPPSQGGYREWGGSIMYAPGKILIMGGGDPPTNTAETIDLNTAAGWQPTAPMQHRRRHMNSTILPDGTVLAVGGTSGGGFNDEAGAVLAAERWNPTTGTWTTLASMQTPRLYHSTAVLLPDGRVLSAGGGRCGSCTVDHYDAEIFSPPYLFASDGTPAVRPVIDAAPTTVSRGQAFTVSTSNPTSITRVTWVRLPATTHAFDQNQWFNELSFTRTSSALRVTAPTSVSLAPPGQYMLFIINSSGVPSTAKIVTLQGTGVLPPAPAAPAAPTNLVATTIDASQIRLSWTDNSTSETDTFIEQCQGGTCTNFAQVARVDAAVTFYQVSGLALGTTYRFRVRAQNEAGISGYSNIATGMTTTGAQVTVRTIVSPAAAKCVEVEGGGQLNGTRIFITPCVGATNRQWTVPPEGFPGEIRIFGTMCFDAFSGQGNAGDRIILWECHGGPNQRWTLTPAGELKGGSGLCVTLNGGATADSTGMAIHPCNGSPSQKWFFGSPDGNLPPVARFVASCTRLHCAFNSNSSTDDQGITARAWVFGDGTTAGDIVAPDKTYGAAGTYTVTLTVTDAAGQTGSQTQTVVLSAQDPPPDNDPPVAAFADACTDLTCTFTDQSTDADGTVASRSWTFGDGGTSTATNPSHTYLAAGSYTVSLTVIDNNGAPATTSRTVLVTAPGVRNIVSQAAAKCVEVEGGGRLNGTRIFITPCNGALNRQWTVPPVGVAGTIRMFDTMCFDAAGGQGNAGDRILLWECHGGPNQRWTLTAGGELRGGTGLCVTLNGGATADSTGMTIQPCTGAPAQRWSYAVPSGTPVNVPPFAAFTHSCTDLTCTFTDQSTDSDGTVASRSWAFGDGGTSTATNPTHTYTAGGSYTVALTVTDNSGAPTTTTRSVTVTAPGQGPTVQTIVSQLAAKCVEVEGGGRLNGTRIFITPCNGALNRQWTVPPVGVAGTIRMFDTMCFDAAGGQGNAGDPIILWECHGGPNQRWTLTAGGELRGGTGLCVTLNGGATADSTGMTIQPCTGAPAQRWSYGSPTGSASAAPSTGGGSTDGQGIAPRAWTVGAGGAGGDVIDPSHGSYTGNIDPDSAGQTTTWYVNQSPRSARARHR